MRFHIGAGMFGRLKEKGRLKLNWPPNLGHS